VPQKEIPKELLDSDGFLAGRFISMHTRYSVAVDPGHEQMRTDNRGNSFLHKESDPVIAQFEQSGLRDHEISEAFERWTFSGLPEGSTRSRGSASTTRGERDRGRLEGRDRHAVERKLWLESEAHPGDSPSCFLPRP
jgi:hypothetical protein